jgi:hypothetical protein
VADHLHCHLWAEVTWWRLVSYRLTTEAQQSLDIMDSVPGNLTGKRFLLPWCELLCLGLLYERVAL